MSVCLLRMFGCTVKCTGSLHSSKQKKTNEEKQAEEEELDRATQRGGALETATE